VQVAVKACALPLFSFSRNIGRQCKISARAALYRRDAILTRQDGIGGPKDDAAPAKLLAAFLPKAEESKLGRISVETVILLSIHNQTDAAKNLRDVAHTYKVDVDAISAIVKQEFAGKEKVKTNRKAAPKPASKPAKKAAA